MAKGVEDTAFYIYNRLVSLNEVGGEPETFGVSVPAFHRLNAERLQRWPHSLLSTSTHDTKRSEDVRARISVLSELPREWSAALDALDAAQPPPQAATSTASRRPSRNDEYLLYQMLLGAWPLEELDDGRPRGVRRRGSRSTWRRRPRRRRSTPAGSTRTRRTTRRSSSSSPRSSTRSGARRSWPTSRGSSGSRRAIGAVNCLAQTLLKLTVARRPGHLPGQRALGPQPGRPGQPPPSTTACGSGCSGRSSAPSSVPTATPTGTADADARRRCAALAHRLTDGWTDGRIKLYLTWRALRFRREHPDLFQHGAYLPLTAAGPLEEHLSPSCASSTTSRSSWPCRAWSRACWTRRPTTPSTRPAPVPGRRLGRDGAAAARPPGPALPQPVHRRGRRDGRGAGRHARGARSTLPLGTLLADFP